MRPPTTALGLTLAVAAALFLAVWGVRDLVAAVRLAADADGVTVVSGFAGRRRLPWAAIERIAVDTRTRRGLRSETLEIDTGEALHLFSRCDLGAQPDEVAERLRGDPPLDARAGSRAAGPSVSEGQADQRHQHHRAADGLDDVAVGPRRVRQDRGHQPADDQAADVPATRCPGTVNVKTRLMTRIGMIAEVSRPIWRMMMNSAANRPKIAVEAPAVVSPRRRQQVGRDVAAEPGEQVERGEAQRPERGLQGAAEHPQRPHVQHQVEDPVVQEHRGEQAVVLAGGDPVHARAAGRTTA